MHAAVETQSVRAALFEELGSELIRQRYLFLSGIDLGAVLSLSPPDIAGFASFWPRLTQDLHMGDGGAYRFRRYGQFDAPPGSARRLLLHAAYEQPRCVNRLNGDVARMFDPLEPEFICHPVLNGLLDWLTSLYDRCEGRPQHWNIRLHPYRIVANGQQAGHPTPEGLHRDGVDYILSMMVSRRNVLGGETTVTDNDRRVLWQRTLRNPLDILIGQDALTLHGVSPVLPVDAGADAWRDVLVIAFTKVAP
jgi:hypothetical protein